jgi:hypothetical protein
MTRIDGQGHLLYELQQLGCARSWLFAQNLDSLPNLASRLKFGWPL